MWTYNGCKQNFPNLTGMKRELKSIEETTNTKLATIEYRMGTIGNVIKEKVQEETFSHRNNKRVSKTHCQTM